MTTSKIIREPQGQAADWANDIREQYNQEAELLANRASAIGIPTTTTQSSSSRYKLESQTVAKIRESLEQSLTAPNQQQVATLAQRVFHKVNPSNL